MNVAPTVKPTIGPMTGPKITGIGGIRAIMTMTAGKIIGAQTMA
jgi:hypothetical protein